MADNTNETGKGAQRPGEGPRRTYATLDLKATEVGGNGPGGQIGAGKDDASSAGTPRAGFSDRLAAAGAWGRSAFGSNSFLSHVTAGVAGAVLTLAVGALFGLFSAVGPERSGAPDLSRRVAVLEQRAAQPASPSEASAALAKADARLKGLEERTAAVAALSEGQAKLAAQMKALEARTGSPELVARIAKLETSVAALAASSRSGNGPNADVLVAKLAEMEKFATEAGEAAKGVSERLDRDLASVKTEATRLGQRVDALRGQIDVQLKETVRTADLASIKGRLAEIETQLQGFLRGESERSANANRVLLTLEIANLKRAMDRGERYSAELEAVKKAAGGALQLTALERYQTEGVRTLPELSKDFRRVADAAIDAEAEPPDASVLDRLVAGAKGIVRVRKAGHDPQDTSVEAITGRIEAALKDGRLGEVAVQGKTLPPKAALAAEDWLKKVEARYAVDRAMAELEASLKASISARPTEPRK